MRQGDVFWLLVAAVLLVGLAALPTVAVFPLELLANLRPQLGALALLLAVAAFTVGRGGAAVMLAVLGGALLLRAPALWERPSPPLAQRDARVIWCNVFKDPRAVDRLARIAADRGADVIVLGETPADLPRVRAALAAWPHMAGAPQPRDHGVVVFSRFPVSETARLGPYRNGGYVTVAVSVAAPTALFRIVATHLAVSASPHRLASRDRQIAEAAHLSAHDGATLMLGDLNATPWTTAPTAVARSADLRRVPTGSGSTWFSSLPILGLPIDHALTTADLRASARIGPAVGSDHLPLIVDVQRTVAAGA